MGIVWEDIHPKSRGAIDAIRPILAHANGLAKDAGEIPEHVQLDDPYYPCSVIRDQTTGRLAGITGFRHSIHDPGEWEMAYNVLPPYRRRRLVNEAFKAALEGWIRWTGIKKLIAVSLLPRSYLH